MSQLEGPEVKGQMSLFPEEETSTKRKQLNVALDTVCDKHGDRGLRPGTLINRGKGKIC